MGMDAEVLAIAPYGVLRDCDALEYPDHWYTDIPDDAVLISHVAGANTTHWSERIAEICGVDPGRLDQHRVVRLVEPDKTFGKGNLGETHELEVLYELLAKLLIGGAQLWYRPNG